MLLFGVNLFAQERDSLFANSLFYNSLYSDGSFVDSAYVANLIKETEEAKGNRKIGLLHKLLNGYYFSNPELTRELAQKALDLARIESNDSLFAFSLHYLGIAYLYLDQYRLSIDTYTKALNTPFAAKRDNFKSWSSMNIANSYYKIGEFDRAAEFYYQAAKLNDSIGNDAFAAKVYDNLGTLFMEIGNFEESIKNYELSLSLLDVEKDKRIISGLNTKLAIIEVKKGNLKAAEEHFQTALHNAIALNDSSKITEIYSEYANALFDKEMFTSALKYFEKGIAYCNKEVFVIEYFSFLHDIGKSYLYLGEIGKAERFLLAAKTGLEENSAVVQLNSLELSLSKLYARTGEWNKFNLHLKKSEEYKASELEAKELATINELKILHETEKKDQQLEAQKLHIANQERQLLLILGIAFALLAGLIISLFLRHKLQLANKVLFQKNLDITKRWNQLQQFYLLRKEHQENADDVSLFTKINSAMTEDQIYSNPELSIDILARAVSSNTKYVSQAINTNAEMNFSTYINTFRIEEAKRLLKDDKSGSWSMDAIAENCGFNNPTSFYQAFKKNTGMTPAAFKNTKIEAA